LGTQSSFSREEIKWMIEAVEGCKVSTRNFSM
jgi:hypothetical protein